MDETAALPACLTDPSVLFVEENDWGDMLYMVQKRLDGTGRRKTGWFIVTVLGEEAIWHGPYTLHQAYRQFDQQLDYLWAVLGHVGALQPTILQQPAERWTEQDWERGWQIVTRRLMGGPADFLSSAEVQTIKSKLDRTFAAGDVRAFTEAAARLIELCKEIVAREGIAPWWFIQA